MLFRGLRLRAGIDTGQVRSPFCAINTTSVHAASVYKAWSFQGCGPMRVVGVSMCDTHHLCSLIAHAPNICHTATIACIACRPPSYLRRQLMW